MGVTALRSMRRQALQVTVAALLVPTIAPGQPDHPKVAVVFSGGSAKGFTQVGVLEVLEEVGMPIDLITGTSMGAIIGGLYAVGYSPRDIERLAVTEDWNTFFKKPTDRRSQTLVDKEESERYTVTFPLNRARPALPNGVLPRQSVAEHLERFVWPASGDTDFARLPTPYAALVTDLGTGKPILMRSGSIAQAMEASASVPGAFAPKRLPDGRYAVDGAVVRNIPASDARALGADILVCVDVSEQIAPVDSLRSLVDILDQTVSFRVQASNAAELPLCTVVIAPEIIGIPSTTFDLAPTWIARGRTAALQQRDRLAALADSVRRLRGAIPPRAPMPRLDSVYVRTIRWTHVSDGAEQIVEGTESLRNETWVTLEKIQAVVRRMYATGRFDQVSFRIVPHDSAHDLIFDLTESDRDVLGIGVRYDTPRGVSLLAGVTVTDWISPGSTASVSARLGDEQQFDARDVIGEGPNSHFVQTYRVTLSSASLPEIDAGPTRAPPVLDVHEVAAEIGRTLSSSAVIGVELSQVWSHDGATGADSAWTFRRQDFTRVGVTLRADTHDRAFLPRHGSALLVRSEIAGGPQSFTRHFAHADGAYALINSVTAVGSLDLGYGSGAGLPQHGRFLLGGSVSSAVWPTQFIPFPGLDPQSRAGRAVQVANVGLQLEPRDNFFVMARGSVGNVFDAWPDAATRSSYLSGTALGVGTMLPAGPLTVVLSSRRLRARPVIEVSFGAVF